MALRDTLAESLRKAFLERGYEKVTMGEIADYCGFTRRALYHHFSSKEEAFRFTMRYDSETLIERGLAAARELMWTGADAVEILTEMLNVRFGETHRRLADSAHAVEINDHGFRRGRDVMIWAAVEFQRQVALLLAEMEERGLFRLRRGGSHVDLAQLICDGARANNQALPPIPIEQLPARYRAMMRALLFGTVDSAEAGARKRSR
ncbi:MAG: TetR/AcrR family transcriptional regulator [Hyphomicrobiales bacterium]|nr:MAG: TetR/AcrR family transcriptional regulator [Hyphomicrobiales bacterium]